MKIIFKTFPSAKEYVNLWKKAVQVFLLTIFFEIIFENYEIMKRNYYGKTQNSR
jgi:hypothetical protein